MYQYTRVRYFGLGFMTKLFTHIVKMSIVEGNFMIRNDTRNIDGFVLRRRNVDGNRSSIGASDKLPIPQQFLQSTPTESSLATTTLENKNPIESPYTRLDIGGDAIKKSDIDESLKAIDAQPKPKKRSGLNRKKIKVFFICLAVFLLAIGGWIGIKALLASNNMFGGNLFDIFSSRELKKDELGRTNILLFGTSEDDPSHVDAGAELTDSIMVLSVDQKTKNAVMFSVPRDLWVDYGQVCSNGYSGKINALYQCAKEGASYRDGATKLMSTVSSTFGLDMHYFALVNYTALRDAVNAVGGITVLIESDDPRGVYDRNFDWQCRYKCNLVKWPNGPANLNGEQALALARARNAAGGYGLGGGNFDREQYQQKILLAIKEKAVSAGTLTNPVALTQLIDSFGENIRTNFEKGEIRTLTSLASEINKDNIKNLNFVHEDNPLMTTGEYSGQSVVRPVAGISNFSEVKKYIRSQLNSETDANEEVQIEILNGSTTVGLASKKRDELQAKGFNVDAIGDAPSGVKYKAVQWYDTTAGKKPKSAKKLAEVLGKDSNGSTLPEGVQSEADFVIIYGNGSN